MPYDKIFLAVFFRTIYAVKKYFKKNNTDYASECMQHLAPNWLYFYYREGLRPELL